MIFSCIVTLKHRNPAEVDQRMSAVHESVGGTNKLPIQERNSSHTSWKKNKQTKKQTIKKQKKPPKQTRAQNVLCAAQRQ